MVYAHARTRVYKCANFLAEIKLRKQMLASSLKPCYAVGQFVRLNRRLVMTFQDACDKAREDSKNGYVQHVCQLNVLTSDRRYRSPFINPNEDYIVSDWYDSSTIKSFENGKEL